MRLGGDWMSLCGELIISKCEIPPVVHYQKVCAWYNILSNGCSPKLVGKYPKKTRKNSMPLLEVHRYLEGGDIDVVRSAAGFRLGSYVQVIKMPRDWPITGRWSGRESRENIVGVGFRTVYTWAHKGERLDRKLLSETKYQVTEYWRTNYRNSRRNIISVNLFEGVIMIRVAHN